MRIPSPFPSGFGFAYVSARDLHDYLPHPDEMRCLGPRANKKRRAEFFLGRLVAFRALQALGIISRPVLQGKRREPLWQDGIVGSISHKDDMAIAVVAWKSMTCGVGVDLESLNEPLNLAVSTEVCTQSEKDWILEIPDKKDIRLKMIFSAKEAAFKAFYPIQQVFLDYRDADLSWHDGTQSFKGILLNSAGDYHPIGSSFEVGCQIIEKFIISFLSLPPIDNPNVLP